MIAHPDIFRFVSVLVAWPLHKAWASASALGDKVFVPFYHQAINGIVERVQSSTKKGLKDMLVDMAQDYKQDWYVHLPWVLLSRRVALIPNYA